jgi:hypothetical protein
MALRWADTNGAVFPRSCGILKKDITTSNCDYLVLESEQEEKSLVKVRDSKCGYWNRVEKIRRKK